MIFVNILKRRPAESFNLAVDENKQGVLFHFNFPLGRLLIVIIIVVILRDFLSRGPTDDLSEVHRWKKRDPPRQLVSINLQMINKKGLENLHVWHSVWISYFWVIVVKMWDWKASHNGTCHKTNFKRETNEEKVLELV